jgi:hypothetical protein
MPNAVSRPPASWSTVPTILAVSRTCRSGSSITVVPSSILVVFAASQPSVAGVSKNGAG